MPNMRKIVHGAMKTKNVFTRYFQLFEALETTGYFGLWCGLILRTFDDHDANSYRRGQLTKMVVMNFITLLTAIRFLLTAAIAEEWIVVLMSDSLYLM